MGRKPDGDGLVLRSRFPEPLRQDVSAKIMEGFQGTAEKRLRRSYIPFIIQERFAGLKGELSDSFQHISNPSGPLRDDPSSNAIWRHGL